MAPKVSGVDPDQILALADAAAKPLPTESAAEAGSFREPPVDPVEAAQAELKKAADAEAAQAPLRRLSDALKGTKKLQRVTARASAIAALRGKGISSPASLVDAALGDDRHAGRSSAAGQGRAVALGDPEPWLHPVEGAALLQDIAGTLSRYVALPAHTADAMALWVVHAHALDAAQVSPMLALVSPVKRCGKTTALLLLDRLVPRPLLSSNISPAAVFRAAERWAPTLLVDEADTVLHENEELRCILNSSHTRAGAYVVRTVGDDHEPRCFSTWAAKAIALIGRPPDTLADRSISIPMRRRSPGEQIEPLRLDRPGMFEDHRRRAARWAADHLAELRADDPDMPGELNDRAADNWRPLLAIADLVGGNWPERARKAALALSGARMDGQQTARELLLSDIRDAFQRRCNVPVFTADLLTDLWGREDRPWCDWKGRQLSANQLARLLLPFGVHPGSLRDGERTGKGYKLDDLTDAFTRYLPPAEPSHPSQSNPDADLRESESRHRSAPVTDRGNGPNPYGTGFVSDVTAPNPEPAWEKVRDGR